MKFFKFKNINHNNDLFQDAISEKYKRDMKIKQEECSRIISVIKRCFGTKYSKQAQILDGKVYLYGLVITSRYGDSLDVLMNNGLYQGIKSLADFGEILERRNNQLKPLDGIK